MNTMLINLQDQLHRKEGLLQRLKTQQGSVETTIAIIKERIMSLKRDSYSTDMILGPGTYYGALTGPCCSTVDGPYICYLDAYYINVDEDGYSLEIENSSYDSQCLRELEAILAEFVCDMEGEIYIEKYQI